MSRYVTVRTQIRDMELLRQTLQCMGLTVYEGAAARLAGGGRQPELVVQTPGGAVGFARDAEGVVEAVGMEESVQRGAGAAFLRQVTQQYARQKITAEAARAGYRLVEEMVDADNTIRLVVRKW